MDEAIEATVVDESREDITKCDNEQIPFGAFLLGGGVTLAAVGAVALFKKLRKGGKKAIHDAAERVADKTQDDEEQQVK